MLRLQRVLLVAAGARSHSASCVVGPSSARRPRATRARCLSTSAHGVFDELEDARGQVASMPEARAAAAFQREGKHRAAVEALARVVDVMRAVPDPAFQQVGLELLCRAALLRGDLSRVSNELVAYVAVATGPISASASSSTAIARPVALLRASNLAALLLIRQGRHIDALSLLQKTEAAVDAWARADGSGGGASSQSHSFGALRMLLRVQRDAAAMAQGVVEPAVRKLRQMVVDGSAGSSTSSSSPTIAEATVQQLAILHLRRGELHLRSQQLLAAPAAGTPTAATDATATVEMMAISGLTGSAVAVEVPAVKAAVAAARAACAALPLGHLLDAIHRVQLAEAMRGPGRAVDIDALLTTAVELGEAAPGTPYTATAPLRALAHVFEGTGDFTTAEAILTGNADNVAAWMQRNTKLGTWSTLLPPPPPAPSGPVVVSDISVAEECLRSIRSVVVVAVGAHADLSCGGCCCCYC
jgi:hypothetical protein